MDYDAEATDLVAEYAQKIHDLNKRLEKIETLIAEAENDEGDYC